ncbi:MAG: hypothetical protein KatS3mg029_1013 [Saprospiraceae bacterium]|nr:MAG: hypothetical protein KatS3mg029_1013 [Saprospiraceae bacterium]
MDGGLADGGFEGWRFPQFQRLRWLYVVMAVNQDGGQGRVHYFFAIYDGVSLLLSLHFSRRKWGTLPPCHNRPCAGSLPRPRHSATRPLCVRAWRSRRGFSTGRRALGGNGLCFSGCSPERFAWSLSGLYRRRAGGEHVGRRPKIAIHPKQGPRKWRPGNDFSQSVRLRSVWCRIFSEKSSQRVGHAAMSRAGVEWMG